MTTKPFASSADLTDKTATLEELAPGVFGYTAQGDPNVGCVIGEEAVLAVEARATPVMAREWIAEIRGLSDLPIRDLVLTHYHAVRVLGASAFGAERIIAHRATRDWIAERGEADWTSEMGRFPRLFRDADSIPGLTWPTDVFDDAMTVDLGGRMVELRWLGRGHTAGDLVVWLPEERVCFAGDLVEAQAAPYMGDAHIADWAGGTLDAVAALGAEAMVGGRGPVVRGAAAVETAIEDTRNFLSVTLERTREVRDASGALKEAFDTVYEALAPRYAGFPIFDHCMPFNVQRAWDELDGIDHPRIWTAERDREVWAQLTG
jgi:glyoxylase-like metal-dependent hydrolase (beta-lactamase superfamily II)